MTYRFDWPYRQELEERLKKLFDDVALPEHGFRHGNSVWEIAQLINKTEKHQVDMEIVYAGCLLHDSGYLRVPRTKEGYETHPKESVSIAREILPEVGFPEEKMDLTLKAILLHDDSKPWGTFQKVNEPEIWYIQDADNIEALGAVGISRILGYCIKVDMPVYVSALSMDDPEAKSKSAVHNIYAHACQLYKNLHTETSRKLAKPRKDRMIRFINDFKKEYFLSDLTGEEI